MRCRRMSLETNNEASAEAKTEAKAETEMAW